MTVYYQPKLDHLSQARVNCCLQKKNEVSPPSYPPPKSNIDTVPNLNTLLRCFGKCVSGFKNAVILGVWVLISGVYILTNSSYSRIIMPVELPYTCIVFVWCPRQKKRSFHNLDLLVTMLGKNKTYSQMVVYSHGYFLWLEHKKITNKTNPIRCFQK